MVLRALFTGKDIEIPKVVQDMLLPDEKVLHAVQQARIKKLITPNNIFVTTKRVAVHQPRLLGLRKNIEDFKYIDMANTVIDHGIIHSTIRIKPRFQTDEVILEGVPKKVSREIFKTIQEGVAGMLDAAPKSPVPIIENQSKPEMQTKSKGDLLSMLQERYISGKLSKKEYESMKKEIVGSSKKIAKKQSSRKITGRLQTGHTRK